MDEVRDSSIEAGGLGLRARGLGGCRDQPRMSTGVCLVQCFSRGPRWTRWGLVAWAYHAEYCVVFERREAAVEISSGGLLSACAVYFKGEQDGRGGAWLRWGLWASESRVDAKQGM
jgi:hypothetical protein